MKLKLSRLLNRKHDLTLATQQGLKEQMNIVALIIAWAIRDGHWEDRDG